VKRSNVLFLLWVPYTLQNRFLAKVREIANPIFSTCLLPIGRLTPRQSVRQVGLNTF